MTRGEKVRQARLEKGLRIIDLARMAGMSQELAGKLEADDLDDKNLYNKAGYVKGTMLAALYYLGLYEEIKPKERKEDGHVGIKN